MHTQFIDCQHHCIIAILMLAWFIIIQENWELTFTSILWGNMTDFWINIADSVVCVGSEWHRFPSSFFIPDYVGQVRWIDDGFRGLLPFPFNSTLGGSSAAPPYFNNKNKASDEQYVDILTASLLFVHTFYNHNCVTRGLTHWYFICCSVNDFCSSVMLRGVTFWSSCNCNDLTFLVEVICQHGRYSWFYLPSLVLSHYAVLTQQIQGTSSSN